jgi:hypothetical protein
MYCDSEMDCGLLVEVLLLTYKAEGGDWGPFLRAHVVCNSPSASVAHLKDDTNHIITLTSTAALLFPRHVPQENSGVTLEG